MCRCVYIRRVQINYKSIKLPIYPSNLLLRSNKVLHSDGKNLARFTLDLEQNLMTLVLMSKYKRKRPKNA